MAEDRDVLYAVDIAKMRGISPRAARAWLAGLEAEHGSKVVGRVGEKLCITRAALSRFLPGIALLSREELEVRHNRLHAQVQTMARVLRDVREAVQDLAEGVQSARTGLYELKTAVSARA